MSFDLQEVSVKQEYRNIDIFISNPNQAIIIENKIYAGDQDRQLERYYTAIRREGFSDITIIYLTLDGDDPSDQSAGTLGKTERGLIRTVSYRDDIHEWLERCIGMSSRHPVIRETIVQYQRVIEGLTGQSFSRGYVMEIKDLLMHEKNIELATGIGQALVEAKIDVQLAFWKELEKQLGGESFDIADGQPYYQKYSKKRVQGFYRKRRRDRYYGIMFKLRDLEGGVQLFFHIAVDWNIYFGFAVIEDGQRLIAQEPRFDHLAELVKKLDEAFKRTNKWIGWKFPKRKFNFKEFNDPNIFALANPTKRAEYVGDLVAEIKELVVRFNEQYDELKEGGEAR